jgi:hypothetical protein
MSTFIQFDKTLRDRAMPVAGFGFAELLKTDTVVGCGGSGGDQTAALRRGASPRNRCSLKASVPLKNGGGESAWYQGIRGARSS